MPISQCTYSIPDENKVGLDFISLVKHYYKSTKILKNSNIFSSDEIVESVTKKLKEQLNLKDDIINNIITDSRGNKIQLDKNDIKSALDFIVANNLQLYKEIGISQSQLSPEYIRENRILNFIKNSLSAQGLRIEEKDTLSDLKVKYADEVKPIEEDIIETLEIEEKTNAIGRALHKTLNNIVLDEGTLTQKSLYHLRKVLEENQEILDGDLDDWVNHFSNIVKQIYFSITSKGRVLSEVWLRSNKEALAQVKGAIDILIVDDFGNVHIYDLKLSKHKYDNWDSAKKLTTDWQLAFYRALLGQHVPINNTELNLISIVVGDYNESKKLQLKNVRLEPIRNRLADETGKPLQIVNKDLSTDYVPGKLTLGKMYLIARKLIPEQKQLDYDPKRTKDINDTLALMFPNYKPLISRSEAAFDIEVELKKAIRNSGFTSKYSDFVHEGVKISRNGWVSVDPKIDGRFKTSKELEDELRPILQHYAEFVKSNENNIISRLRNTISQAIQNQSVTKIDLGNAQESAFVKNVVNKYVNGDYRLISNSEELDSLGLILLQNTRTGAYVILNVTVNNLKVQYDENYSIADIEYIKALTFFNFFESELQLNLNKIENIEVMNIDANRNANRSLDHVFEIYSNTISSTGVTNNLHKDHLLNNVQRAEELVRQEHRRAFNELPEGDKQAIKEILDEYDESAGNLSLFQLKEITRKFVKQYPELEQKTYKSGFDFNNPIERLFAYIQVLLLAKADMIPEGDLEGNNNYNIRFSNLKTFFSGLLSKDIRVYDENERKLGGLIEGLKTSTPDKMKSKDLQNINGLINGTNNRIGSRFIHESVILNNATKKYYKDINYDWVSENVIANHRTKFKNLWVTDNLGNVTGEWRVKNPYDYSPENALTDAEREYLKQILFRIYINGISLPKAKYDAIDISSIDSIMKTAPESMIEKINKGTYFEMPIIRSQQWNRYDKIWGRGYQGVLDTVKSLGHEIHDYVDGRELEPEELHNIKKEAGFYEMYDVYAKQSRQFIQDKVAEKGEAYWELDLDAIAHRVIFNKIRKKYLDNILPVISAYIWTAKISGGKQNIDISNELEYALRRLKLASKDEHIIDEDFEDVVSLAGTAKRITTKAMLAFRPALLVKELTIGLYKNYMLAATQMLGEDQFNMSDLTKAIGKLMSIDNKFSAEWNLIDMINHEYRFANLELGTLPNKYKTNRKVGFFKGFGKWMFSMNTIPDYYNRLSLFLAKMIHDGSYDAHVMDEKGHLIYDPRKDKRFSYYFENRDKHKNSKGQYIPAKNDSEYNKQRNLYLLLINQISKERQIQGDDIFTEEDLIDKAYSEQERNSFKSFTDTVYGYYDKDSQAEWHNAWYGMLYLQFLQFWPGKMSLWFGTQYNKKLSPIGKHVHKTQKDANGKEQLMYKKPLYEDPANPDEITGWEPTTEDTGDPILEWQGTAYEGLYFSMLHTLRDILKGDWENIKNEKVRSRRALYGLAEGFLMYAFFKFLQMLFEAWISENGTDGINGETIEFMASVNRKVLNESNVLDNTFGALRSEPAFWTYTMQVSQDMYDVMTGSGNRTPQKLLARNIRAFEFWDNH